MGEGLEQRNLFAVAEQLAARAATPSTRRQYAAIYRSFGDWLRAELGRPPVVGDLDAIVALDRAIAAAAARLRAFDALKLPDAITCATADACGAELLTFDDQRRARHAAAAGRRSNRPDHPGDAPADTHQCHNGPPRSCELGAGGPFPRLCSS